VAILGTGIDLIEVERVRRALESPGVGERLRFRVFTEREVRYCESRGVARFQSYAARFAAKEAAMKALGTGWGRQAGWRDFEIVREAGKPPQIVLSGKAAALARQRNIKTMHLSISHTVSYAIAYVIAEG